MTYGDIAADVAVQLGRPMDAEQRLILDAIYAEARPGIPTCFEVGVIAPRQNLKTATLEVAAITDVFVLGEQLHVWTAHLFKTAVASFRNMVTLIEGSDDFRRRCRKPRIANGDEAIELLSGEKIEFHARSKGGGRGRSGAKVTVDEALFLQPTEVGAMFPILATLPGAQVRYGSSAGLAVSEHLRRVRDRGRRGGDPRLAWLEWEAPHLPCDDLNCSHEYGMVEGCTLDIEDLWFVSNPALGGRITLETMRSFRRSMPPDEFAREFLGWWDEPLGTAAAFGAGRWEAGAYPAGESRPRDLDLSALAVAVSYELTHASIGAAADDGQLVHVKPLQHGPGTAWLPRRARQLQEMYGVDVVVDGKGPAAGLIRDLEDEGVRLRVVDTTEVLDACAGIFELVRDGRLRHGSYPELDAAVAGAVKRTVGDRWAWGRKTSTADISTLEAVTLAARFADQTVPPPPPPQTDRDPRSSETYDIANSGF